MYRSRYAPVAGYPAALGDAVQGDVPLSRSREHLLERLWPFDARDLDPVLAAVAEPQRRRRLAAVRVRKPPEVGREQPAEFPAGGGIRRGHLKLPR
jgi:hypothetical protein